MGLFSKPKPPAVPNYKDVSAQQTTANTGAADYTQKVNTIGQSNPFGNLNYNFDPNTGTYSASQNYSPQQQMLFNLFQGTQGVAGQQGQNLLGGANYGAQQPSDVIGNATSGLTGDLTSKYMQTVGVQQGKQHENLDAQLRNQGLVPGMPGYDRQMQDFTFNTNASNANATANFENQAFGQAQQNYELPAMLSQQLAGFGAPGNIMQNLWNTPQTQVQPANVTGAAANMTQAQIEQYKQQMQNRSDTFKTIGQIGGAAAGMAMGIPPVGMMGGMFGSSGSNGAYSPQQFNQMAYGSNVTGNFAPPIYG